MATMTQKTIYLDSFALARVSANPSFANAVMNYINANNYALIIGIMNLMEIHTWPKRWADASEFIASVPFCIAQNSEQIAAHEVRSYPYQIALPIGFCSAEYSYSKAELKEALEINLKEKIASFEKGYRNQQRSILDSILNNRSSFLPEENGKYSTIQRLIFLQINVLRFLYPDHKDFLEAQLAKSHEIKVECFKSVYIQALAIFLEYYVQKKDGKPSDIGDLYQLAIIPYADLAIIDNERNDLLQRVNRDNLFPTRLSTCNIAQFKKVIGL